MIWCRLHLCGVAFKWLINKNNEHVSVMCISGRADVGQFSASHGRSAGTATRMLPLLTQRYIDAVLGKFMEVFFFCGVTSLELEYIHTLTHMHAHTLKLRFIKHSVSFGQSCFSLPFFSGCEERHFPFWHTEPVVTSFFYLETKKRKRKRKLSYRFILF